MSSLINNEPSRPAVPECAEGWLACFPDAPCARHADYWQAAANNQAPQPPAQPAMPTLTRAEYGNPVPVPSKLGNPVSIPPLMEKLEAIFTYQPPRPDQLPRYSLIRAYALEFSRIIVANTPQCADQTAAIRKVREAVMTANAAIALDGLV